MNKPTPACYVSPESFPLTYGADHVYLVEEEGFDGCTMPLYSQEAIDNLLLWQNNAAAVMARFISLSDHPNSFEWGKAAFDAAMLISTGVHK